MGFRRPDEARRCRPASKEVPGDERKPRAPERWPESSGLGLAGEIAQAAYEPGKLQSKLARLWPCNLLSSLVSMARLLRQPGKVQSRLARLWPCHLLASLVSLERLLRQPCDEPGKPYSKLAKFPAILWMRGLSDYLSRPSARCAMFFAIRFWCTRCTDPSSRPSVKERVLRLLDEVPRDKPEKCLGQTIVIWAFLGRMAF